MKEECLWYSSEFPEGWAGGALIVSLAMACSKAVRDMCNDCSPSSHLLSFFSSVHLHLLTSSLPLFDPGPPPSLAIVPLFPSFSIQALQLAPQ